VGLIVLDISILVYATGVDHPLRAPCRDLIGAIADGAVHASTTPEVIQEFLHVRSRRTSRRDAVALGRDLSALLDPLIVVDPAMLALCLRLYEETETLGAFDAVLCAAALSVSADALVSADRAFAQVPGLAHLDPGSAAFAAWLDGARQA
jgi:predicted nucleic acid-binding protein